jgi:arsenate reductase
MAEGLMRSMFGDRYEPYSAGIKPTWVHPLAIAVMNDVGIDITSHYSKHVDDFKDIQFDYVVTVCDEAKEKCPIFSKAKRQVHRNFTDPSAVKGSNIKVLNSFKIVRDQIKEFIEEQFEK